MRNAGRRTVPGMVIVLLRLPSGWPAMRVVGLGNAGCGSGELACAMGLRMIAASSLRAMNSYAFGEVPLAMHLAA